MPKILEIDPSDLQKLTDVELRELIGRLCEAEFRKHSLLVSDVFWGGDQNASDGGIDVYVNSRIEIPPLEFIPKRETAFQVKKPKMPRSEIINEMKPNGILRPDIASLDKKGAYIIVSAKDLTSKKSWENRKEAMRDSLEGLAIEVDFLDQFRIAQWISCHPSILVWTRATIGKTVKGWRSWGNWCNVKKGVENAYLLDNNTRFIHISESRDQLPVLEGIQKIRQELSKPGGSARLVGLSGTGKTRFAQALFEEEIGTQALNRHQVLYTDLSDSPDPIPTEMLAYLGREGHQTILVVDNCNSSLHRKLVEVAVSSSNNVSFLTIEYDIQDDIPEETEVFKLEPSSEDLIETLVLSRNDNISQIDARTIARMSGGNARLGIALANTVKRGESLSDFTDRDLFSRLFHQGQKENIVLEESAEALSLVYSINIENANQENSELAIVGKLIKKDGAELHRHLAELCKRELAQSRGNWRAVLPHALANRLARDALKKYPKQILLNTFEPSVSLRLTLSFSRRLSYLHNSEVAVSIADNWLASNGWLGQKTQLSHEDLTIVMNIASVIPDKTLEFYERLALRNSVQPNTLLAIGEEYLITTTIVNLAYDRELFEPAVNLLIPFALEDIALNQNKVKHQLETLFHIYLSGTHATVDDRLGVIKKLLDSKCSDRIKLALILLDALLKCTHFIALGTDSFGARFRNYGYIPRTFDEVTYWYGQVAETCLFLMSGEGFIAESVNKIFGDSLRALISEMGQRELVEDVCIRVRLVNFWPEAWISLHEIIEFDKEELSACDLEWLIKLRNLLEPKNIIEKVKGFVLYQHACIHLLDERISQANRSDRYRREAEAIIQLGIDTASNERALHELLPLLIKSNSQRVLWLAQGLYRGAKERLAIWDQVEALVSSHWMETRNTAVLRGFLRAAIEADSNIPETLLARLLENKVLRSKYVFFQLEVPLDYRALKRLYYCLENDFVPLEDYRSLRVRFILDDITENDFINFVKALNIKKGGDISSIEIIYDYISALKSDDSNCRSISDSLIYFAQNILVNFNWKSGVKPDYHFFYDMGELIQIAFKNSNEENMKIFVDRCFDGALENYYLISSLQKNVIDALFKVNPFVVLQSLMELSMNSDVRRRSLVISRRDYFSAKVGELNEDDLVGWARSGPTDRTYFLARFFPMFKMSSLGSLEWRDIFWAFLDNSGDIPKFLSMVTDSLDPSGVLVNTSRASLLESRLPLLEQLFRNSHHDVRIWAKKTYQDLIEYVKRTREFEQSRSRIEDESFE